MAKITELFEAYAGSELPHGGGFLITEILDANSRYARYEVISYGNVKDIYRVDDGILFQADGRKLFIPFEPPELTVPNMLNRRTAPRATRFPTVLRSWKFMPPNGRRR